MGDPFADIVAANQHYADAFALDGLSAQAARGLAVLTCIDSRIEPLAMLGLQPGDAKIVRNAGARLTDDALRSLALATHLLGVDRIVIVIHTDCAMGCTTDAEVRAKVRATDPEAATALEEVDLHTTVDPRDTLREAVATLRGSHLVAPGVVVAGFQYDVHSGRLEQLV